MPLLLLVCEVIVLPGVGVGGVRRGSFEGLNKLVVGFLAQNFTEVGGKVGLGFPVNSGGGLCKGGAVVYIVPQLCVQADVVVVHGGRGPLDVGNGCAGLAVVLCVAFASPACDVERLVLATIGEV